MKWACAGAGALLIFIGCFLLLRSRQRYSAPSLVVVSECKAPAPETTRVGNTLGVKFDFATTDFTVSEGTTDTVPVVHGFRLRLRNGVSVMDISFGRHPMQTMATDPALTFSKHVEKRPVRDGSGHTLGEDYWGYLNTGERWREARFFRGGIIARYGFANEKDAALFDQVIRSACQPSVIGEKSPSH